MAVNSHFFSGDWPSAKSQLKDSLLPPGWTGHVMIDGPPPVQSDDVLRIDRSGRANHRSTSVEVLVRRMIIPVPDIGPTIIATVFLLLQFNSQQVDTSDPRPDLAPALISRCIVRHRCDYVDAFGKPVTPAIFKMARPFFEGRASVLIEGRETSHLGTFGAAS